MHNGDVMNLKQFAAKLQSTGTAITALTEGLEEEAVLWKPDAESWSIKEVIYHLAFEEIFDFRKYIGQIFNCSSDPELEETRDTWTKDDPRKEEPLEDLLRLFTNERDKSLAWLGKLEDQDWDQEITFPWGSLKAGDFLISWQAHDLLHLRQLVELRYTLTANSLQLYRVEYAGAW
jgi:hypothetical protein